jgi:hypothetical protein
MHGTKKNKISPDYMNTLIVYVYSVFNKKCNRIKRSPNITTSASRGSLGSHKREYEDRTMDATNIIIDVK